MTIEKYREDYPCTCHLGHPPCSNCTNAPDFEMVSHGATVRYADSDELVDDCWWQMLPDGFVHDHEGDLWHRAADLPDYGRGRIAQPQCGLVVEEDTSCWFDEAVVGVSLCLDCEQIARIREHWQNGRAVNGTTAGRTSCKSAHSAPEASYVNAQLLLQQQAAGLCCARCGRRFAMTEEKRPRGGRTAVCVACSRTMMGYPA